MTSINSSLPDHWPRVWRGESSGDHFEDFDMAKTRAQSGFFFAASHGHAAAYSGAGSEPRSFVLDPGKILDLRDPYDAYIRNPDVRALIDEFKDNYDEWVDRGSGEPGHPNDWIEAGNLYSYDGDGSGERWHDLFATAHSRGYDSVVVRDVTDGQWEQDSYYGGHSTVWVVFDPTRIHFIPQSTIEVDGKPPTSRRPGPR